MECLGLGLERKSQVLENNRGWASPSFEAGRGMKTRLRKELGLVGLMILYIGIGCPALGVGGDKTLGQEKFRNSLGMDFLKLPPGSFTMGSPQKELFRDEDETPHLVKLTRAFFIQETEVTQAQWKAVMGSNPSFFTECGDQCPVERVSWNDVARFLEALNKRGEGRYRLPTEAEWEYACRAGSSSAFSWGGRTRLQQRHVQQQPQKGSGKVFEGSSGQGIEAEFSGSGALLSSQPVGTL